MPWDALQRIAKLEAKMDRVVDDVKGIDGKVDAVLAELTDARAARRGVFATLGAGKAAALLVLATGSFVVSLLALVVR